MSVFAVCLVRIQSERGKIRNRKTPNTDTFHAVIIIIAKDRLAQEIFRFHHELFQAEQFSNGLHFAKLGNFEKV